MEIPSFRKTISLMKETELQLIIENNVCISKEFEISEEI